MNILLLRGLCRDSRHWLDFPEKLKKSGTFDIHTLDLPGIGSEFNKRSPKQVAKIVDYLTPKFKELKNTNSKPWSIVGHSLGGMVALNWAQRRNDFKHIIIINSSAAHLSKTFERIRPNALMGVLKNLRPNLPEDQKELILLKSLSNLRDDLGPIAKKWSEFAITDKKKLVTLFV